MRALVLSATLALLPIQFAAAVDKSQQISPVLKQAVPGVKLRPNPSGIYVGPAPTDVTLTPVTPTSIQIRWSPVPNATEYVISRNGAPDISIGANAGFLQNNRYGYMDMGRWPATLHTYSVAAKFPAPTLPGRSAGVQLLTPHALAPKSFRGTVSGPNAVTLTWAGQPEANAGYRIVRNGGNQPPTGFDAQGLLYVDRNLPPGEYTYTVASLMRLANGEVITGEYTHPVKVSTRPFNIVAIGDSVMWGQGLLPANKFATRVRDWLAGQLGKTVDLRMRAHSGAITYPTPGGPIYENRSYDGEVPSDWPTISHQVTLASAPAAGQPPAHEIDLVLIDGCANNIGIITVLNPFADDGALRNDTRAYCGAGMTNILREVVTKFPKADVIVTGYFPYVSRDSDLAALMPVFVLVGAPIPPDPILGSLAVSAGYRERIAARSDLFFQESNASLQAAVNTVNQEQLPNRTKYNQIRFARLNAGPNNSYAAPNSWQFLIPAPPFAQDEVYEARRAQCYKVLGEANGDPNLLPGANLLCIQASMGHPNAAGAQGYTSAIQSVAAPLVSAWRTAHVGPVTAREEPVVLQITQSTMEPSGGTMLIIATDGPVGAQLPGTVQLNGVAAGQLGTPFRYTFQPNNPREIMATVNVAGRGPRQFLIPSRTFSIAIQLINDGDPRTALVTATDNASGQLLNGTVTVRSNTGGSVSGQIGQPLTYPSCGPHPLPTQQVANMPVSLEPCFGTVNVPFYPEVGYQDVLRTVTFNMPPPNEPIRMRR